ncbi:MAG TPA: NlpC/P60 family protein [Vicinamibacteria bacterium]|nr:NlpC/P60 family protein [Vicinamibacteria bacterium]
MILELALAFSLTQAAAPPAAAPPAGAAAATLDGVVIAAVENMYSAPDATRDVVSQAFLGQPVKVVETRDGFARIETPDRYRGWIPSAAIFTYPAPGAPRYASRGPVAEVTSLMANVYREPDVTSARPRTQAPLGARLEVVEAPAGADGKPGRWITVRLPTGERGYVQRGDVKLTEAGAAVPRGGPEDLVRTARRFLGIPYLWGGISPMGVDCSGFTSRVYAVNGVVLPRDARLQFDDPQAVPVERAALQPGDLLFFGQKRITHVGMYVGDGRFIHATTHETPVVQESRLDDPHWTALFKGARRPR